MLNPTGNELDELHRQALGNPKAIFAFKAYVDAINERDDLIRKKQDTTAAELDIRTAHEELERLLTR